MEVFIFNAPFSPKAGYFQKVNAPQSSTTECLDASAAACFFSLLVCTRLFLRHPLPPSSSKKLVPRTSALRAGRFQPEEIPFFFLSLRQYKKGSRLYKGLPFFSFLLSVTGDGGGG